MKALIFVTNEGEVGGTYANASALIQGFVSAIDDQPGLYPALRDACAFALANPGEKADARDGDYIIAQTVQGFQCSSFTCPHEEASE